MVVFKRASKEKGGPDVLSIYRLCRWCFHAASRERFVIISQMRVAMTQRMRILIGL